MVSGPVLIQVSEMVSVKDEQTENDMVDGFRDQIDKVKYCWSCPKDDVDFEPSSVFLYSRI